MRVDAAIPDPAYHAALLWLYGLSPNVRTAAQIVADHPRKLVRMRALLDLLGSPDQCLPSVLIAGTKGKGSVAASTEAILHVAGVRTGLVTSPHLTSWCERTRINGRDIEPATAARLLPTIRTAVERLDTMWPDLGHVTTFEAGFAFALIAFKEAGVELAVVEAGVGGLHDATNVLDPLAVALSAVSYDHTATLGPTLTDIVREKVGVFRPGRLAVTAEQPDEARMVIERAAATVGVRLESVGGDWRWLPESASRVGCGQFCVSGPRGVFTDLSMPLLGRHQRENATLATALASEALQRVQSAGLPLPSGRARRQPAFSTATGCVQTAPATADSTWPTVAAAVRAGLAAVRWPGRLQSLQTRPWLVVDGAHNGDSAVRLAEAIRDCFQVSRTHLILGTSVGKDIARMLDALLPLADRVTLTRSHHERSAPLDALARIVAERGVQPAVVPEVDLAIAIALAQAATDDLVLVTGSLFVVGEALERYGANDEAAT